MTRLSVRLPSLPFKVAVALLQLVKVSDSVPQVTGVRTGAWNVPELE